MATPRRRVDPAILRRVVDVIRRGRAIEICYQSLTRDDPLQRWVTPHAFGFDGLRWHVRAFCHIDRTFKDFVLPRFLELGSESDPIVEPSADHVWNETTWLSLDHSALSNQHRGTERADTLRAVRMSSSPDLEHGCFRRVQRSHIAVL
jgi:predicted DNA-binding transcriptional regulator YafY